jgi:hypothetical protein
MTNHLEIFTIADLTWQNGIEFAVDGVNKAHQRGVNLLYTIIGDGPLLEAVAFAIHDSELTDCCQLLRTGKIRNAEKSSGVFLFPAVAPGYKLNFDPNKNKKMHWIVTSIVLEIDDFKSFSNTIVVPRWDSRSIANALVSSYQRKNI